MYFGQRQSQTGQRSGSFRAQGQTGQRAGTGVSRTQSQSMRVTGVTTRAAATAMQTQGAGSMNAYSGNGRSSTISVVNLSPTSFHGSAPTTSRVNKSKVGNQSQVTKAPLPLVPSPCRTIKSTPREREAELSALLECPICYCIPEGDVINCERGHSICSLCCQQLNTCALCSSPFQNGSRNYLAESLISYFRNFSIPLEGRPIEQPLIVSCPYKSEGCKKTLLKSELIDHAAACDCRRVPCVIQQKSKCGNLYKLSELFEHLLDHNIEGQCDSSGSGKFTKVDRVFLGLEINTTWPPYYLKYDNKVFLRFATIQNRCVYWWVSLIGRDADAKDYKVTCWLQNPQRGLKISWDLPVQPIRRCMLEVTTSDEVASLPTSKLLPFCRFDEPFQDRVATHLWSFYITINKAN